MRRKVTIRFGRIDGRMDLQVRGVIGVQPSIGSSVERVAGLNLVTPHVPELSLFIGRKQATAYVSAPFIVEMLRGAPFGNARRSQRHCQCRRHRGLL